QALKASCVLDHGAPGVGKNELFAGAVDELFAEFQFEALQRERDGGLCAQEFVGGARKALFGSYGEEDLERIEFHTRGRVFSIITHTNRARIDYKFFKSLSGSSTRHLFGAY